LPIPIQNTRVTKRKDKLISQKKSKRSTAGRPAFPVLAHSCDGFLTLPESDLERISTAGLLRSPLQGIKPCLLYADDAPPHFPRSEAAAIAIIKGTNEALLPRKVNLSKSVLLVTTACNSEPLRVALLRHSDTGTRVRNELIVLKPYTISSLSHPSGAAFIAALTHSTVKCDSSSWDFSLSGWQSIRKLRSCPAPTCQ
jgi:hypothetical protein